MRAVAAILDRLSASLNAAALWGAVAAVVVMVLAASWQVVARYILAAPPIWTEELARYAMVWAGMLGASCAFRAHADPNLFPTMRDKVGPVGALMALARLAGVAVFAAPVLYYSLLSASGDPTRGYLARLAGRNSETLGISMAWFGLAIPIAFALIFLHLLADFAARLSAFDPDEQQDSTP